MVETSHFTNLWRSSYGPDTTLEIAAQQPALPILCKFLGHTATSRDADIAAFRARLDAANEARSHSDLPSALIQSDFNPNGWHSYLTFAQFGAENLQQAAAMKSLTA